MFRLRWLNIYINNKQVENIWRVLEFLDVVSSFLLWLSTFKEGARGECWRNNSLWRLQRLLSPIYVNISWKSNQQAKIDSREQILSFIDFPRSVGDLVLGHEKNLRLSKIKISACLKCLSTPLPINSQTLWEVLNFNKNWIHEFSIFLAFKNLFKFPPVFHIKFQQDFLIFLLFAS